MKIKIIYFAVVFLLLSCSLTYPQEQWEEIRSDHFIVYFYKDFKGFAEEVSIAAEGYYDSIAEELGYVRYSNFWKWDKRVKIYIYPDHNSYLLASQQQSWSHGVANYIQMYIMSYVSGEGFLDKLLVHEITHLIFRDFIGFKSDVPLWLDEGVAQWEVKSTRLLRTAHVLRLAFAKRLISLDDMMNLDIRKVQSDSVFKVRGLFNDGKQKAELEFAGDELVSIYYLQAFSLVGFLITKFGADDFIVFSRQLRDGKDIPEALQFAYPMSIRSIDNLEKEWKEYILN